MTSLKSVKIRKDTSVPLVALRFYKSLGRISALPAKAPTIFIPIHKQPLERGVVCVLVYIYFFNSSTCFCNNATF